ncbi:MAG TPA: NUDIX hydrolase [Actinomycetota bacterium]|nr:NUDIX hydrolase [Actinomycetota bacterium]
MAPQIAVGAIVVKDGCLLMVRRAHDPGAGLWSLPGGRVEHGEYLAAALRREVAEETGLDVEVRDLVGILEVVGDPHYVILDYFAEVTGEDDPVAADDVSEARWVPLGEVGALPCTPRFHETLRGWGVLPQA